MESLTQGLSVATRKSAEHLSRTGSSSGYFSDSNPTSAADISASLLDTFRVILAEVDGYISLYEGRLKLEEDYLRSLKALKDRQADLDAKVNAKMATCQGLLPDSLEYPGLRKTWRELRENDLREIDARSHAIETIKQAVLTPLLAFRDSQERIRKRVKEDLRTSLSHYDDMLNITLPRIKKAYEKKAEEVEQLELQQQAIEDQRALLSAKNDRDSQLAIRPGASSPEPDVETGTSSVRRSRSARRHSRTTSAGSSKSFGPGSRSVTSSDEKSPATSPITLDTDLPPTTPSQPGAQPSSPNAEKSRPNFFDAFKSREGWEAARKEAPKKLGAFISRMREGREGSSGGSGGGTGTGTEGSFAASVLGSAVGETLRGGLPVGVGSMKTNQTMAVKQSKAKREVDEADKAYRKAIFDLETSRLRRSKTIKAAVSSLIECRSELALTAQAVWIQSERSMIALHTQGVGLHEHGVETVRQALVSLDSELKQMEELLPNVRDLEEKRISYVNRWHGELKNLIFGTPLTDYPLTVPYRLSDTVAPPLIVTKCINFIETHALDQPGIYRTSAKHSSIKAMAIAIEKDELGFQFDPQKDEATVVAGVFKDYLRQLPEPVMAIPWADRIKYTHEREEHIRTGFAILKGRIRRLPPIHQVTLKVILQHLSKVAEHSDQNKMTAANLSVVFSPCLLSEADHETTSVAAAMEEDKTMEDLIVYCNDVLDLSTAGAPILPPITPGRGNELGAAFGTSSPPSAAPDTDADAKDGEVLTTGAGSGLKRTNAITLNTTGSASADPFHDEPGPNVPQSPTQGPMGPHSRQSSISAPAQTPSLSHSRRSSNGATGVRKFSGTAVSSPRGAVAASIAAFENRSPPSLSRLDTTGSRRRVDVPKSQSAVERGAGPSSIKTTLRAGTDPAPSSSTNVPAVVQPNLTEAEEKQPGPDQSASGNGPSIMTSDLSGEDGQMYLAASSSLAASPIHSNAPAPGLTSTGPLTPGRLTPSSLRSPLDSVIDSAHASHGHVTPTEEATVTLPNGATAVGDNKEAAAGSTL